MADSPRETLRLDDDEYDVVVMGTDLPHSILAAALARAGKRILHIDTQSFYGHGWASFTYSGLVECLQLGPSSRLPISECSVDVSDADDVLQKKSRMFQLDLRCRLLFSNSEAVTSLIRSGVSNYLQFRPCNLCYTYEPDKGALVRVPTSKQQVFCSDLMMPADKRRLMKLLHLVLDDAHTHSPSNDNSEGSALEQDQRPFHEYLASRGLSEDLISLVLFSLCFAPTREALSTSTALYRLRLLLRSFGRFSSGAFLYPIYGTAELAQAFCRLSAVYGAVYVLRCSRLCLVCGDERLLLGDVDEDTQQISCEKVIADTQHMAMLVGEATNPDAKSLPQRASRCICVSTEAIQGSTCSEEMSPGLCLATLPPGAIDNPSTIRIVQLDETTSACPAGFYVIHFSMRRHSGARDDLEHVVTTLVPAAHRRVAAYFCMDVSEADGPDSVDVDAAFIWARHQFSQLCPGEEFLRARDEDTASDRDAFVSDAFEALMCSDASEAALAATP